MSPYEKRIQTAESEYCEVILLMSPEDDGYEDVKQHIRECLGYAD